MKNSGKSWQMILISSGNFHMRLEQIQIPLQILPQSISITRNTLASFSSLFQMQMRSLLHSISRLPVASQMAECLKMAVWEDCASHNFFQDHQNLASRSHQFHIFYWAFYLDIDFVKPFPHRTAIDNE